jgi:preprotein translocase subunit SecD
MITAVILYYFTSGFVQGFALALLIGVVISMFSAITVTRSFLNTIIKDHA